MTTKQLMMAALLAAAFAPAQAWNLESPSEPAVGFRVESFDSGDEHNGSEAGPRVFEAFNVRGPMPHGARVVKNAPYSAAHSSAWISQGAMCLFIARPKPARAPIRSAGSSQSP